MDITPPRTCIIVTGPTASGKTAFAIELAAQIRGGIINADSMQLYDHLCLLTARPSDVELASHIPYALDGVLSGPLKASTGWWLKEAAQVINTYFEQGLIPIIVGGTGLYLKSLVEGISPVPDIPEHVRTYTRSLRDIPFDHLKNELAPTFSEAHLYKDPQRLLRAYEVFLATGQTLNHFQGMKKPPVECRFITIALLPGRAALYQKIDERFIQMMENGAIAEVEGLLHQSLAPDHPILKATGVGAITGYLNGDYGMDEVIILGQQHTRQYAKRQLTWIKNQLTVDLSLDSYAMSLAEMVLMMRSLTSS